MATKLDKKKYLNFAVDYFQDEDGVYTAVVPALKGCIASGKTLQGAYKNVIDAIESCLEARKIIRGKLSAIINYASYRLSN